LSYAISVDNETPQTISLHGNYTAKDWERWVADNVIIKKSQHKIQGAGKHILKFWSVDPGIVLQKIVVETKEPKPSYLGPPETKQLK
jgi:hypothetical protein